MPDASEVPTEPVFPVQAALPAAPQFTDLAHLGSGRSVAAAARPKSADEALAFLGAMPTPPAATDAR